MAQADSQSTTDRALSRRPETHLAADTVKVPTTVLVPAADPTRQIPSSRL